MSFLPNSGRLTIDPQKLTYLLQANPGKAKFFAPYDFDLSRPQEPAVALHQHPVRNPYYRVTHTVHAAGRAGLEREDRVGWLMASKSFGRSHARRRISLFEDAQKPRDDSSLVFQYPAVVRRHGWKPWVLREGPLL